MWKRWLMGSVLVGFSYIVSFVVLTWLRPCFGKPADAPAQENSRFNETFHNMCAALGYLHWCQRPDADYCLTTKWAKIKAPLEAKEAAIAYLKQQPEFRQALQELRQRKKIEQSEFLRGLGLSSENQLAPNRKPRPFNRERWLFNADDEESFYRAMVVVVDLIVIPHPWSRAKGGEAKDENTKFFWLVRVLAPYSILRKRLLTLEDTYSEVIAPTLQELLIDAKTGSVRPVIPWDRWAKQDTGKLYPPRIPERIRQKYDLPEVWVPILRDPAGGTRAQPGSKIRPLISRGDTGPVKQP